MRRRRRSTSTRPATRGCGRRASTGREYRPVCHAWVEPPKNATSSARAPDQLGDRLVGAFERGLGERLGLVPSEHLVGAQLLVHRVHHDRGRQRGARVVEVNDGVGRAGLGSNAGNVDGHGASLGSAVARRPVSRARATLGAHGRATGRVAREARQPTSDPPSLVEGPDGIARGHRARAGDRGRGERGGRGGARARTSGWRNAMCGSPRALRRVSRPS